jgi:thioredoxin 1
MTGCASPTTNFIPLSGAADFGNLVQGAGQPVLVEFYKDSCPTCVGQEFLLDQLAQDYRGRVAFAKLKIMEANFTDICPEVTARYNLRWVPTVVLFVRGQEMQRWELNHTMAEFREGLDKVLPAEAGRRDQWRW